MTSGLEFPEPSEELSPTGIDSALDPRLQRLLVLRQRGIPVGFAVAADFDEVPVIAKVSDAEAWEQASEVRASVRIGGLDPRDNTTIVTGRIPIVRIEAVRHFPFVKSLKAAVPLKPTLAAAIAETGAGPGAMPAGALGDGGRGVVIGIVDFGCDFAHRNVLDANGRTRLLAIWDQGGIMSASGSVKYGREYDAAAIDAALAAPDPYAALGYGPAPDAAMPMAVKGTHGTHVMDICAGGGAGSGVAGFAPGADLIFVDVAPDDIVRAGPDVVKTSFGDSTRLLEAVEYIFRKAGGRPCVINISLGTNGGPHDGTTLVEQGIDRLLAAAPNRAVTLAAANAYEDGIHASGTLGQDAVLDLAWDVPPGAKTDKEFELWYDGRDRISVEIVTPSGRSLGTIAPGTNGTEAAGGHVQVFVANRLADPNNGDNVIGIFLDRAAASGRWTVRLTGDAIVNGAFHAWIERDDLSQSSFAPPHDRSSTIGSISCGQLTIAVGSYDAHTPGQPLSWFSSAGPTRDGREKPEVSGPGHDVLAAHSRTGHGVIAKSGTSMAAPAAAGIVALVLAEAQARGLALTASEIRDIVIATARRDPPPGTAWHDRYGHGRISAAAAVAETIRRAGPGPVAGGPIAGGPVAGTSHT